MTTFWRNWLLVWSVGVLIFGVVLAGGAFEATSGPVRLVYQSLQGPGDLVFDPAMRFTLAVMGCVSIGWAVTMFLMIRAAFLLGAQATPIWMGLTAGVVTWFVTDSSLSVATGFGLNVVPNTVLMVTYLIAILGSGALKRRTA
jgi:hypothetical protein